MTQVGKIAVLTAFVLCGLAGSPAQEQRTGNRLILGQGNVMCRAWTDVRRGDPAAAEARTAWVLGYLTAYSQFGGNANIDVSDGKSTEELTTRIDAYCARHPNETLQQAATALVDDLRGKTD
jgi:hypothetical protein